MATAVLQSSITTVAYDGQDELRLDPDQTYGVALSADVIISQDHVGAYHAPSAVVVIDGNQRFALKDLRELVNNAEVFVALLSGAK